MLHHDIVLKSDELYIAGEIAADGSAMGERAAGLYLRDTRHLSRFALTLNDAPLMTLGKQTPAPAVGLLHLANDLLRLPTGDVLPQTVAVEARIELGADLRVAITLSNFSGRPLDLELGLDLAADFRDLFDIRGATPKERGTLPAPAADPHAVSFSYDARDGRRVGTVVRFDQAMSSTVVPGPSDTERGRLVAGPLPDFAEVRTEPAPPQVCHCRFPIAVPVGGEWTLAVVVIPQPADAVVRPVSSRARLRGEEKRRAVVTTDKEDFNRFVARADLDLAMLQTTFPNGSLPAAGIPWYVAPFGRDSLIVGLQTVHVYPARAAGILRVLAALQGAREDAWTAEEPGKILHEIRYGEMARAGDIPHTPYFGTVDATPLFVLLFAEVVAWSDDRALYAELLPNIRSALDWIDRSGDLDGDGLVEYRTEGSGTGHISNKVWKDSGDSLHDRAGNRVTGTIAAVEVQGYVYAACARLADVAAEMGDGDWAAELRARAERTRQRVEDAFWLEADGFYAQALDTEKRPVAAISSNPGHLLYCGLPSPERAAKVAQHLAGPDLNSGWGIRTLSAAMPSYNPMSYHNGSVWPHDNSLIIAGLRRYGYDNLALDLIGAFFDASRSDPLDRLPELYCGFPRADGLADAPVAYPVSCIPQAWAAAASHLLVRSLLGLEVDYPGRRVGLDPALPPWLSTLTHLDLSAFGRTFRVDVSRRGDEITVASDGPLDAAGPKTL